MKTLTLKVYPSEPDPHVVARGAEIIRQGGIVAFPTETVYGLAADAFNPNAVLRVFEAKNRPVDNPLPVQIAAIHDISRLARDVSQSAFALMDAFFPGPLTIVLRAAPEVPEMITAGTGKIGIRMPNHPVALALIRAAETPIVAPSANKSGQPPATTIQEVLDYFNGKIELVLDAGPTVLKTASTVVDMTEETPRILRIGSISEGELLSVLTDLK